MNSVDSAYIEELSFFSHKIFEYLKKICSSYNFLNISKNNSNLKYSFKKSEVIVVIGGEGGIVIGDKSSIIKAGDIIRIPQNSTRSITNVNSIELKVISVDI